jgi:hypothetical protein
MGEGPGGGWQTRARHGYPHLVNNKCTCHMSIYCFLLNGKQIKLIRNKDIEVNYLIHTFGKLKYVLFDNSNICSDVHNCY